MIDNNDDRNNPSIMSGFISNMSIRGKLLTVIMIVSTCSMLLASSVFVIYQWYAFRQFLAEELLSQAGMISNNTKSSLAFNDPKDAHEIMESLGARDSIALACLYRNDGSQFASWSRDNSLAICPADPGESGYIFTDDILLARREVIIGSQPIGAVVIQSDLRELQPFISNSIIVTFLMLLIAGSIAFILSARLQNIISGPIMYLADLAEAVFRDRDYSKRAVKQTDDEVGHLADGLNNMLSQIEERETQLRRNEEQLRAIIDNTSSLVFLKNLQGNYIMANQRFADFLNLNINDIQAKSDYDFFPLKQAEIFQENDMKVLRHGKLMEFEEQATQNDVVHTYISVKFPLYDENNVPYAVCGIATDISERIEAATEMRQLRNYLNNIIDSMPSVLVGVNPAGLITQWNKQAEKFSGISSSEAKGRSLLEIMPEMASEMDKVKQAIRERTVKTDNRMINNKNGEISYTDLTIYPLVANGVTGAVIRLDDVTERVRIEEMMVQTEKMMSVGGLAAGMAHEINNPLGIMMQSAQNVIRRVSPKIADNVKVAEQCGTSLDIIRTYLKKRLIFDFVEDIRTAGARAAAIVSNMLQFSRRSDSVKHNADIIELLDKTVELAASDYDLKKKYDFRHIKIVREYESGLPLVPMMVTEIEQVMLNLLKNAAQAVAELEDKKAPMIIIRIKREDDQPLIRVEIEDNGVGMAEDIKKRSDEPFFTTKPVGTGTGLDLSVSYMIITNNHYGTINVESTPGQGTKFIICLPLNSAVEEKNG
jgi:PAS domain S-box-containing protein